MGNKKRNTQKNKKTLYLNKKTFKIDKWKKKNKQKNNNTKIQGGGSLTNILNNIMDGRCITTKSSIHQAGRKRNRSGDDSGGNNAGARGAAPGDDGGGGGGGDDVDQSKIIVKNFLDRIISLGDTKIIINFFKTIEQLRKNTILQIMSV